MSVFPKSVKWKRGVLGLAMSSAITSWEKLGGKGFCMNFTQLISSRACCMTHENQMTLSTKDLWCIWWFLMFSPLILSTLWQLHMLNFWHMVKQYHYPFFKGPWVHRSSNKVILKQSNPSKQINTRHIFSWDQCRFRQPTHCMWVS